MFSFEYDVSKSKTNFDKHGINFEDAQKIWSSDFVMFVSKNRSEERMLDVGKLGKNFWSAIITFRGEQKDIIRIISVRRSRYEEKELYEKYK